MLGRVPIDAVARKPRLNRSGFSAGSLRGPQLGLGQCRHPSRRSDSTEAQAGFVLFRRSLRIVRDGFGVWMLAIGLDPVLQHPVLRAILVARVGQVRDTQEIGADQDP